MPVQEAKLVLLKVHPVAGGEATVQQAWEEAENRFTLTGLQSAMAELRGLAEYISVRLDPTEAAERQEMHQEVISLLKRLIQSD